MKTVNDDEDYPGQMSQGYYDFDRCLDCGMDLETHIKYGVVKYVRKEDIVIQFITEGCRIKLSSNIGYSVCRSYKMSL